MSQTHWNPDLYARALRFAAEAHVGQAFPGTELPYLLHVTQVAQEVAAATAVEPDLDGDLLVACALLHDTLEDTPVTFSQLEGAFSAAVANGVLALTKREHDDQGRPLEGKPAKMADSLERIRRRPREIWCVKLADRITNLQPPPPHWNAAKCNRYRDEARMILSALEGGSAYLAERLRSRISTYGAYCG